MNPHTSTSTAKEIWEHLKILNRVAASGANPEQDMWLKVLLSDNLDKVAAVALEVGNAEGGPIHSVLATVLRDKPSVEVCCHLYGLMSRSSTALSRLRYEIRTQLLRALAPLEQVSAHWDRCVRLILIVLKRVGTGCAVTRQNWRLMARCSELELLSGLAQDDLNLGNEQRALNRSRAAIKLLRELDLKDDRWRELRFTVLFTHFLVLDKLERIDEVASTTRQIDQLLQNCGWQLSAHLEDDVFKYLCLAGNSEQAMALWRKECRSLLQPSALASCGLRSERAAELHLRAIDCSFSGLKDLAVAHAFGATRLYFELAGEYPDIYEPKLAGAFDFLASAFAESDLWRDALDCVRQQSRIYTELAMRSSRYRDDLVNSLIRLSAYARFLGLKTEALAASKRALRLVRDSSAGRTRRVEPKLADALYYQSFALSARRRTQEAISSLQEAAASTDRLAKVRPISWRLQSAEIKLQRFACHVRARQIPEALKQLRAAYRMCRRLVISGVGEAESSLLRCLYFLIIFPGPNGSNRKAIQWAKEGIRRCEKLSARQSNAACASRKIMFLLLLGNTYVKANNRRGAANCFSRATTEYPKLDIDDRVTIQDLFASLKQSGGLPGGYCESLIRFGTTVQNDPVNKRNKDTVVP